MAITKQDLTFKQIWDRGKKIDTPSFYKQIDVEPSVLRNRLIHLERRNLIQRDIVKTSYGPPYWYAEVTIILNENTKPRIKKILEKFKKRGIE